MDALVRVAQEQDAEAACQVLRRSIAECCADDHGGDPKTIDAWLSNKTPTNVRTWILYSGSHSFVAEVHGVLVGFASVLNSGEITLCYVLPEVQFKGVGKALLTSLEAHALGRGMKQLHLESTKTAYPFYIRHGYRSDGQPVVALGMVGFPMVKQLEG